jgi:hypothetical protein
MIPLLLRRGSSAFEAPIVPKSFVDQTSGSSTTNNSTSVARPTTLAGDVLIFYMLTVSSVVVTVPEGWTPVSDTVNSGQRLFLASKIATGSEPTSYTFTTTGTSFRSWWCASYRGATTVTAGALATGTWGPSSAVAPQISMPSQGILIAALCNVAGGSNQSVSTPPTGMDSRIVLTNTVYCLSTYDKLDQAAGATGTRTAVWTGTGRTFAQLIGLT